ncbi:MAG: ZIP family metal transporter [Ignisphaera sp.]
MVDNTIYHALLNGFLIAGLTSIGTLPSLAGVRLPRWGLDFSLGFASGVMVVASFTSLIIPAFEKGLYIDVGIGMSIGVIAMVLLDAFIPHEHIVSGYEGPEHMRNRLRKAVLLAIAIAIHNIPEGLAVGVTTVYSIELGFATAIAIGLQDIPEGAAVALPLAMLWRGKFKGFAVAVLSGLVETVSAVAGATLFAFAHNILGIGMGFSAGAMIYIVVEEILPEILHETSSYRRISALGFFLGFYTMLYLDALLS